MKHKKQKKTIIDKIRDLPTWVKITALVLIVLIIAASIVLIFTKSKLDKVNYVPTKVSKEELSCVDIDGYVNILVLGVDSRNMNKIKGSRSDAIMILSINEQTKDVKLVSVYRDTFLKIGDTNTYDKITHACVYGGPEMTMKSLNQAMDLNIENYVIVNFKSVADLVDKVGGVDINVKDYELSQLNKYTRATARNIGYKYSYITSAGKHTLSGVQAVSYGRIRKGVGDDFKRTQRMRIVLRAVYNKVKECSPSQLNDIANLVLSQIQTNMKSKDLLLLASNAPSYKIQTGTGWPYSVTTGLYNGVSYVFPDNLKANTIRLHKNIFEQQNYVPSGKLINISNTINEKISNQNTKPITDTNKTFVQNTKPNTSSNQKNVKNKIENTKPSANNSTNKKDDDVVYDDPILPPPDDNDDDINNSENNASDNNEDNTLDITPSNAISQVN